MGQKQKGCIQVYEIPNTASPATPYNFHLDIRFGTGSGTSNNPVKAEQPMDIDWGDGTTTTNVSGVKDVYHNYTTPGDKEIRLTSHNGRLPCFNFRYVDCRSLLKRLEYCNSYWYVAGTQSTVGLGWCMFYDVPNVEYIDSGIFKNNREVTNITYFAWCVSTQSKLDKFNLTDFISHLPNLAYGNGAFNACKSLEAEYPKCLPPTIINASGLFSNCIKLHGSLNADFFKGCDKLTDVGNIFGGNAGLSGELDKDLFKDCVSLTSFANAFNNCPNITGNVPDFPPNATNISSAYATCTGLTGTIPEFPSGLLTINGVFSGCRNLVGPIPDFPSTITGSFNNVFYNCNNVTGEIRELPPNITDLYCTFQSCYNLTGGFPDIPVGVTRMVNTFFSCTGMSGVMKNFPPNLKELTTTFYATGVYGNIPPIPEGVTDLYQAFSHCPGLTGEVPIIPQSTTRLYRAFEYCSGLVPSSSAPYVPQIWETNSAVTDHNSTFSGCSYTLCSYIPASWGGSIANWASSKAYTVGTRVFNTSNNKIYTCQTAHTSGSSFDASKWVEGYDLPS